jgi:hypothetical protein
MSVYMFGNNITVCNLCIAVIFGCQLCQNNNTCILCGAGWNLYYNITNNSTICVNTCPSQYYSYQ